MKMRPGDYIFIALCVALLLAGLAVETWRSKRADLRGETPIEEGWGDDADTLQSQGRETVSREAHNLESRVQLPLLQPTATPRVTINGRLAR